MQAAICPGSFDPITVGHLDIIERAAKLYDKLIVGVATDATKKPLFSLHERVKFISNSVSKFRNVEVEAFDSLLVEFARKHEARTIIKGLRAVTDFEHEFQMAQLNHYLDNTIETVFMMASPKYAYLSSSAVKEIAHYGGSVRGLVTAEVELALREFFKK
jgi:pantetheine-phosphate adenylyltransferase